MRVLACGCYSVISDYLGVAKRFWVPFAHLYAFTFMHLVDAFIQSDLQCVPWELNPQPFALLTQCSTTEPQEHMQDICHINICRTYATGTYAVSRVLYAVSSGFAMVFLNVAMPLLGFCLNVFRAYMWHSKFSVHCHVVSMVFGVVSRELLWYSKCF